MIISRLPSPSCIEGNSDCNATVDECAPVSKRHQTSSDNCVSPSCFLYALMEHRTKGSPSQLFPSSPRRGVVIENEVDYATTLNPERRNVGYCIDPMIVRGTEWLFQATGLMNARETYDKGRTMNTEGYFQPASGRTRSSTSDHANGFS